MHIEHIDHFVLTVADIDSTVEFYSTVLGMSEHRYGDDRRALLFGRSKINLHQHGSEVTPNARHAQPGSADVCLIVEESIDVVVCELSDRGVPVEVGPVQRHGARGLMTSVYIRDPDGNLIELSEYQPGTSLRV
ncbi:VOC family protein [Rhodococcus sp. JS3073]|uniref:VOC family protein n=1 Tax=Rhodococcus sp. JS3073 TaxID=3002901 RepID=UPI0022855EB4|nr:VOC family protein [Rhodococcus sp. JS3073]WAM12315.1 VOC family protein [Rhodococcus sp. JS3073]